MAERPQVKYQDTEDLLLFRLQFALAKNENLSNSLQSLSRILKIPLQLIRICANRLEGSGYCNVNTVEEFGEHPVTGQEASYNENYLEITEAGVAEVEAWPAEKYWRMAELSDLTPGDYEFESNDGSLSDSLGGSLGLSAAPLGDDHTQAPDHYDEAEIAPASDRQVTLDHNSAEYKRALTTLDQVTEEIRRSNIETSYEKDQVVTELSLGRQLLENTRIRIGAAVALLLTPLFTVYHDVAAEALRPLVKSAVDALRELLGLS
jgi:hypothetical protein